MTRQLITVKIASRTALAVNEAIQKIMTQFGEKASSIFKSITADNGSEFATLADAVPFADIYFAHPYSSFERGTNEKQNSLIRRFFPREKVLKRFPMKLFLMCKIGSIIFLEKSLIIRVLMTYFNIF